MNLTFNFCLFTCLLTKCVLTGEVVVVLELVITFSFADVQNDLLTQYLLTQYLMTRYLLTQYLLTQYLMTRYLLTQYLLTQYLLTQYLREGLRLILF
jgi:hypothetical protein